MNLYLIWGWFMLPMHDDNSCFFMLFFWLGLPHFVWRISLVVSIVFRDRGVPSLVFCIIVHWFSMHFEIIYYTLLWYFGMWVLSDLSLYRVTLTGRHWCTKKNVHIYIYTRVLHIHMYVYMHIYTYHTYTYCNFFKKYYTFHAQVRREYPRKHMRKRAHARARVYDHLWKCAPKSASKNSFACKLREQGVRINNHARARSQARAPCWHTRL